MYESTLREEVSQGDIFSDVPIAYVKLKRDASYSHDGTLLRPCCVVLLTRDCDYDKPNAVYVIVAEIRPLSEVHPNSQGNIRLFRTVNTFHLQEIPGVLEESYVDFRRIDRVEKIVITERAASGRRLASLSEEARLALQRQVALFFGFDMQTNRRGEG